MGCRPDGCDNYKLSVDSLEYMQGFKEANRNSYVGIGVFMVVG